MRDHPRPHLEARKPESGAISHRVRVLAARVAVAGMIVVTAVVLGRNVSIWLVPAYLLLMGWLLLVPSRGPVRDEPAGRDEAIEPATVEEVPTPTLPEPGPSPIAEVSTPPVVPEEAAPPRPRKGKGRGKARSKDLSERPPATWVRVGPGKFVRVEGGETARPSDDRPEHAGAIATTSPPAEGPAESIPAPPESPPSLEDPTERDEAEPPSLPGSCIAQVAREDEETDPIPDVCDPEIEAANPEECADPTADRNEAERLEPAEPPAISPIAPPRDEAGTEGNQDGHHDRPTSWSRFFVPTRARLSVRVPQAFGRTRAARPPCRRASGRVGVAPRVSQSRAPPRGWIARLKAISGGRFASLLAGLPRFR